MIERHQRVSKSVQVLLYCTVIFYGILIPGIILIGVKMGIFTSNVLPYIMIGFLCCSVVSLILLTLFPVRKNEYVQIRDDSDNVIATVI